MFFYADETTASPAVRCGDAAGADSRRCGVRLRRQVLKHRTETTLRPQLKELLRIYFEQGGAQSMITVLSRGDLEAALAEPEKYRHLIVRVGGFSARFVDLGPVVQKELLARTLY